MDKKIEEALQTLRDAGYYVENLWSIEDVKRKFLNLNEEECMDVLDEALTNEYITEQIFEEICDIGIDKGYKMIND